MQKKSRSHGVCIKLCCPTFLCFLLPKAFLVSRELLLQKGLIETPEHLQSTEYVRLFVICTMPQYANGNIF